MEKLYEPESPYKGDGAFDIPEYDIVEDINKRMSKAVSEQILAGVITMLRILLDEGCIKVYNPDTKKKISKKKAHEMLNQWVEDFYKDEKEELDV